MPDTVLCSAAGTAAPIACLPSFLDRFAGGIVGSVSHVQVCTAPHACRAPKPQLRPQATSMAEEDIWVTTTHDSLSRSPARLSPHTAAPTRRPSSIPPHATCVIVSVCTMKRRQAGRPSRTFSRIIFIPSLHRPPYLSTARVPRPPVSCPPSQRQHPPARWSERLDLIWLLIAAKCGLLKVVPSVADH